MAHAPYQAPPAPVHPHMRGDNLPQIHVVPPLFGSPPHAWGQCESRRPGRTVARFTPTCVGTMSPRAPPFDLHLGSPPHAWGQYPAIRLDRREVRFTPTCVGTIMSASLLSGQRAGSPPHAWGQFAGLLCHTTAFGSPPHAWGQCDRAAADALVAGSPPHAWGQWRRGRPGQSPGRFTPTCVGTILKWLSTRSAVTVHPHMRGDNQEWEAAMVGAMRFTPTCVGTMKPRCKPSRSLSVHPHMRGDNGMSDLDGSEFVGSPPHAWGQCGGDCAGARAVRFTPTCVGTIFVLSANSRRDSVHPHMRGDNVHGLSAIVPSPVHPHMRGDNCAA